MLPAVSSLMRSHFFSVTGQNEMTIINRRIVSFVTIIQFATLKGHHKGNQL